MTHTEKDDLVEHCYCEDLVDEERDATGSHGTIGKCDWCKAATRITALERELAEARQALKPFADEAKNWSPEQFDSFVPLSAQYTVGDLRRAARTLETKETK